MRILFALLLLCSVVNAQDTCQITQIFMPSYYGGVVRVNDSTNLYKAVFGVLPPLKTDTDITPRVYRFNYSGFRLTLFKTGAWIRQRRINGQWVEVPF
jgi:hypothetical protein